MNTTLDLAREVGYAKLSIEAVAARAGVGKDTIYRRWPSKALQFLDAVLSSRARLTPKAGAPGSNPAGALCSTRNFAL